MHRFVLVLSLTVGCSGLTPPQERRAPSAAAPAPRAPAVRFRLVTWNIHQGFSKDPERADQWAEMRNAIALLDPDVTLLQETVSGPDTNWAERTVHHGADAAAFLGGQTAFAGQVRSGTVHPFLNARAAGMFGNATVATLPFAAVQSFPLSDNRTALLTTVAGVRIANVHFTAADHAAAAREAEELLLVLHDAGPAPTVIAGDLNARVGDAPLAVLENAGYRYCFGKKVDHVLTSPGVWCGNGVAENDGLSDHPRIAVEIQVGE